MSTPSPEPASEIGRLDSWKQIAGYLDKSERTVRRWSQTEGLPVHKHQHQQRGTVWAFEKELDEWLSHRVVSPEDLLAEDTSPSTEPHGESAQPLPRRAFNQYAWIFLAAAAVAVAGLLVTRRPTDPLPEPEPFTSLPGVEMSPAFSPDSRRVAFFWANPELPNGIYTKERDSEKVTPLVVTSGFNFDPAWSPDGKTIAFIRRTPDRNTWLCLIAATGGPEQQLA